MLCCASLNPAARADDETVPDLAYGKSIYDFYCYQCHGYSGDARTLAASYLMPRPRDFTASDPVGLTREDMIDAVINGRPGTAMVSFESVVDGRGIESVVDFIRTVIMKPDADPRRYHTPENGWANHERFAAAFPFAQGELSPDTSWQDLSPRQRQGRKLYLSACVTCHDRAGTGDREPIWDLRPLSYPRNHYSHRSDHVITGASPYAIHDVSPDHPNLTAQQKRGQALFEDNCAFCHAADGTGQNWIGRFMQPHARNLTDSWLADVDTAVLREMVLAGVPGTSMPAWRDVLSEDELTGILTYVTEVLAGTDHRAAMLNRQQDMPRRLVWLRSGR